MEEREQKFTLKIHFKYDFNLFKGISTHKDLNKLCDLMDVNCNLFDWKTIIGNTDYRETFYDIRESNRLYNYGNILEKQDLEIDLQSLVKLLTKIESDTNYMFFYILEDNDKFQVLTDENDMDYVDYDFDVSDKLDNVFIVNIDNNLNLNKNNLDKFNIYKLSHLNTQSDSDSDDEDLDFQSYLDRLRELSDRLDQLDYDSDDDDSDILSDCDSDDEIYQSSDSEYDDKIDLKDSYKVDLTDLDNRIPIVKKPVLKKFIMKKSIYCIIILSSFHNDKILHYNNIKNLAYSIMLQKMSD
jgi:hypothetical protein